MKEIDQRNKNDLLIRCNCGSDHFLQFSFDVDEDKTIKLKDGETREYKAKKEYSIGGKSEKVKKGWKDYYISFIDRKDGFWWKLKDCYKYLFTRDAQNCYSGVGITSKDMNKIIEHFKKYQSVK